MGTAVGMQLAYISMQLAPNQNKDHIPIVTRSWKAALGGTCLYPARNSLLYVSGIPGDGQAFRLKRSQNIWCA